MLGFFLVKLSVQRVPRKVITSLLVVVWGSVFCRLAKYRVEKGSRDLIRELLWDGNSMKWQIYEKYFSHFFCFVLSIFVSELGFVKQLSKIVKQSSQSIVDWEHEWPIHVLTMVNLLVPLSKESWELHSRVKKKKKKEE